MKRNINEVLKDKNNVVISVGDIVSTGFNHPSIHPQYEVVMDKGYLSLMTLDNKVIHHRAKELERYLEVIGRSIKYIFPKKKSQKKSDTELDTPSDVELLLLSVYLLYHGKRILDREIKSNIEQILYTKKSIEVMRMAEDYINKHITRKEYNKIKKEFKIDYLYDE